MSEAGAEANIHPQIKAEVFGEIINKVTIESKNPTTARPVLYVPGFAETPLVTKEVLSDLATNRRVLSFAHLRHGGETKTAYPAITEQIKTRITAADTTNDVETQIAAIDDRWRLLKRNYSETALRRALTVIGVALDQEIDKIDVVAHSFGAIDTMIAAYLYPDLFQNIVLNGSSGIIGKDHVIPLMNRTKKQLQYDASESDNLSLGDDPDPELLRRIEEMREYFGAPKDDIEMLRKNIPRAVGEIRGIANTRLEQLIPFVRSQGIKVAFLHGVDDYIFPMERVQEQSKLTSGVENVWDAGEFTKVAVDGFLSIAGSHNTQGVDPRRMKAADWLLTKLEANSQLEANQIEPPPATD